MADCLNTSEGLTPLTELAGTYNTFSGFLYPGSNTPPAAHVTEGSLAAAGIVRRDTAGNPSGSGAIAFVSVGMSNTRQEFSEFQRIDNDLKAGYIYSVNGAQTAQDATQFADSGYWDEIDLRLANSGLTPEQVGCMWIKTAVAGESGSFPTHAQTLQGYLKVAVQTIASRYPNCKAIIFSSRIYGGYADIPTSPEPWAYEGGFAVKWLIEDQINHATTGDPDLAYNLVPWLGWGPYLWADGLIPRIDDGLTWECSDFEGDGTHPATRAEEKVAEMLLDYMETAFNMGWFAGSSSITQNSHAVETDTTDQASYVTSATWTPTANALQLVAVLSRAGTTPPAPTVTGHSLTYVQVTSVLFATLATNLSRLTVFRAMGAAPTNGALTIDFGGATQTHCTISVMEFEGADTSGTDGSGAIGQFEEAADDSVNSLEITLPSSQTASGSAVYAAFANANGTAMIEDSDWAEVHDVQSSTPLNRLQTQYNLSFDITASGTLASAFTTHIGGIALEIIPEVDSGSGDPDPDDGGALWGIIISGVER